MYAERLLCNGRFWGKPSTCRALAVREGKIFALGSESELEALVGPTTERIDLADNLVTAGLWDAHIHLSHWSRSRSHLQLSDCRSAEEVLEKVRQATSPEEWIVGWHLNTRSWNEPALPTREQVDEVSGERPVILWLSDLHSALVNTQALQRADLMVARSVKSGVVEVDAQGRPSGLLREMAANLVRDLIPEPNQEQLKEILKEGVRQLHQWGITAVCDQRIKDFNDGAGVFRALRELEGEGCLGLRVSCNVAAHHLDQATSLGLSTGFGTERLRLGHVKIFSDGTLGSKTARMLQPLKGEEQRGIYLTPPEEMAETIRRAAETGFSLSVHSIGDESNRVCLDLFEQLRIGGSGGLPVPHRIEHAQFVDDRDLERFADLDLTVSAQPGHALDDRLIADDLLGPRGRIAYRFQDFQASGARMAFGSDGPVSSVDPRYGLQAAVHRRLPGEKAWYPGQCLSFEQALRGYTLGAAQASGWQACGVIAKGALADLVVWEKGVESAENMMAASILLTISGGKIVWKAP